ncbi:hypothetical protein A0128_04910 [Leptospira tipperaryensis]|uniref:Uncharacterized protein n=1 Tax=Leptospira tipperaryensis TaxID=2564040 RepID=A0A1D7UUG4_9LEPT|nr:hypothetical protein A0128_04910 [Leptospira tipperaryensis]
MFESKKPRVASKREIQFFFFRVTCSDKLFFLKKHLKSVSASREILDFSALLNSTRADFFTWKFFPKR